jgi:hypothetical protein
MSPQEQVKNLQTKRATAKAKRDANALAITADDAARLVNAEADVLGLPRPHEQLSDAKRADLIEAQAACVRIIEFVDNQMPGAVQQVENAIAARRSVQGQHIRAELVPPLLEAAQEAGAVFGRALASLAAAEDTALRLQSRPGTPYGHGNASALCAAMSSAQAANIYCDVGPGRGAWDWPGYSETAAKIEEQIQEVAQ